MIRPEIVQNVQKLLAAGKLSHRLIALRTGVSRTSIAAIASGKRRLPPPKVAQEVDTPPRRCQHCGMMVITRPCRICAMRQHQQVVLATRRLMARAAAGNRPSRRPAA
jgi:hypothetical protein